jgi:hypothetical protein
MVFFSCSIRPLIATPSRIRCARLYAYFLAAARGHLIPRDQRNLLRLAWTSSDCNRRRYGFFFLFNPTAHSYPSVAYGAPAFTPIFSPQPAATSSLATNAISHASLGQAPLRGPSVAQRQIRFICESTSAHCLRTKKTLTASPDEHTANAAKRPRPRSQRVQRRGTSTTYATIHMLTRSFRQGPEKGQRGGDLDRARLPSSGKQLLEPPVKGGLAIAGAQARFEGVLAHQRSPQALHSGRRRHSHQEPVFKA